MVDLNRMVRGYESTTFITPRIGMTPGGAAPSDPLRANTADNVARQEAMTNNLFRSKYGEDPNENTGLRLGKYLAAAGVDMADMIAGSLVPGVDRGAIWGQMREGGMSGLADFAERNKTGVELTSGIVASVATAGVVDMAVVPFMAARLASSTFLSSSKLYQAGNRYMQGAKLAATDAVRGAAISGEMATVLGTADGKSLLRAKVAEGLGRAATQEAAVAAVTHSNQEMWSDDASTNLMMLAFGVGVGGALGGLGARYEMRQIANSDEMLSLRSAASDPYGWTAIREQTPGLEAQNALGGGAQYKESVNFTTLMMTARTEAPADLPALRRSSIEQEAKQAEIQADGVLQKMSNKGIEGVPQSGFNTNAPQNRLATQHIKETAHDDPTMMFGFDDIGVGKLRDIDIARHDAIDRMTMSGDVDQIRKAREMQNREVHGLVNKTWMPDSIELRKISNYEPGNIVMKPTSTTRGHLEFTMDLGKGRIVKMNESGKVLAQGRKFESLEIDEQLKVYEGLNLLGDRLRKQNMAYVLPADSDWLQLDFALDFAKKGGRVDLTKQSAFKDLDAVEMGSLRKKAGIAQAMSDSGKFGFWERAKLNLPLPSSLERIHDGSSTALAAVLSGAAKNADMTVTEARQIRKDILAAAELRQGIKSDLPAITGDMFSFNRDANGAWRPMVVGTSSYQRVTPELMGSRASLVIASAENKVYRTERLMEGVHSRELTEQMMLSSDYANSASIRHLANDQVTGAGNALDRALGSAVTQRFRARDSVAMTSAQNMRAQVDRSIDEYTNRIIQDGLQGTQNKLAGVPNRASKALVDQWFTFNSGWDLKAQPRLNADNTLSFVLDDTPRNATRLKRAVTSDDVLVNPNTGKPIVLDQAGMEFVNRFQAVSAQLLKDTNAVRASRGMAPIGRKTWYAPPPDTRGKIVGFTIGADGKTIPGGAVVASTQAEFDAKRTAIINQLDAEGKGSRFFSQKEIEATGDLWDSAEMGWVDPGFVGSKNVGQTGALSGNQMNVRAMEDAIQWIADRVRANANGTVRSMYDQQLQIARARSAAENAIHGVDRRTIYDEWEAAILGRPLVSVKPGTGTKFMQAAENLAQSVVNSGWPLAQAIGASQVAQWTSDLASRMGVKRLKNFKTFDELATQLGERSPYANTKEFLEANTRVSVPPEVQEISSGINRFSASMLLRWFEFPNAAMNMIGVITNMPSIVRSPSTPLLGTMVGAKGQKIGVIDSYKIMAGGFSDMLSGSRHADWDFMVKNGDTTQSIAELNKQLSLIESKSTFWKVMGGDKTVQVQQRAPRSLKEAKQQLANKGLDGMISLATDTTESMSRAWSHFIGLRLADANGIVGREARHSFAREVANQAIANYNPLNKPEIYQTSLGSMFGLFASYMQQYNQRLFRWMETGDYLSAGRQLAWQGALFGVASVPGYNAVESLFTGMGDQPDATLTDAIYAKFGPKVGSVIAHGGITELPKILGFDNSIALYTRGDANMRSPTLDPTRLMAGLNIVKSVTDGIWEAGSTLVDPDKEFTGRAMGEILARQMPNRAMKGALQAVLTDGQEINAAGQIVSTSKNWMETAIRMTGARTTRQQGEIEAYYANTEQRRRLAGRMETLRAKTDRKMRSGEPVDAMALFNEYVEKGGSPTHFKTWIQDRIKGTTDTRGMRQFVDSLKSPSGQLEAWRYEMRQ